MIAILLGGILIVLIAGILISVLVVNTVKVRHRNGSNGDSVRIETPLGDVNIDARENLNPDTIGVPIYPGATREHGNHRGGGGVSFAFEGVDGNRKNLSVAGAAYSTNDSAEKVREFYRSSLPNWTFTQRNGHGLKMEFSEGGYKRIIAIDEKNGNTHIGIASIGDPGERGVN